MAYDPSDIRSQLNSAAPQRVLGANVAPQYFEFGDRPPTETTPGGSRSWWVRSQAAIMNYVDVKAGDTLACDDQLDEYVILIPAKDASITLQAGGQEVVAGGESLAVMPPGGSAMTASSDTTVVRLFTTQSDDLCQRCDNNDFYATPDPNVAEFRRWPDPPDGFRIRVYPYGQVEPDSGRFGRIYRCTTFMVNYIYPVDGPRDPAKLSPHHHDDFEQLSLQLEGDYVHHMRTPWVPDMGQWREDEHHHTVSPAVTVIPPPSIHTSEAVGDTWHQLIDIFSPPRFDFSERPGWVLNADEYPQPEPSLAASQVE